MNAREQLIRRLERQRVFSALDAEIGCLMLQLDPDADPLLGLMAGTASLAIGQGHSCVPLAQVGDILAAATPPGVELPDVAGIETLREALDASPLVGHGDDLPASRRPLQLDAGDRLYINRYHRYECAVAADLRGRLAHRVPEGTWPVESLRRLLQRHFTLDGRAPDWQAVAVLTGLVSPLTVVTGGPGTGKTSTVLWLLAALLEQASAAGGPMPVIRLTAPTGKAAARLGESLRERLQAMDVDPAVREAMPTTASTLHRLLGVRNGSTRFHHDRDFPLGADVVVVDEVSMVDLPLMAKLLDALPATSRLVLLGDRDQLASVEAGNVLAGICRAAGAGGLSVARARRIANVTGWALPSSTAAGPFADAVIELRTSHRFDAEGGLAQLASCIRTGDAVGTLEVLADAQRANVDRIETTSEAAYVVEHCGAAFAALADCRDPAAALRQAARLRILTALREGPSGCVTLNAALEHWLRQRAGVPAASRWYPGRLVLITENDAGAGLFNGDVGIVMADGRGRLGVCFPAADGGVRSLPFPVLPAHDSAFAMTIHKSQGSEFDAVVIVLPRDDARVLGRELLYTAVTRARERVHLVAGERVLQHALARSSRRFSGLAERLSA